MEAKALQRLVEIYFGNSPENEKFIQDMYSLWFEAYFEAMKKNKAICNKVSYVHWWRFVHEFINDESKVDKHCYHFLEQPELFYNLF